MLYFRDKSRPETWESAEYSQPGSYYKIYSLKKCTSSDVENKNKIKAGANADARAGNF